MSNPQRNEQDDLQKHLEEKAKQAHGKDQEPEILSAYDACVLKESAKVCELIAKVQREVRKYDLNK